MAGPATLFQTGDHASRPAAGAGCVFYNCTDHNLVYLSDGSSWTTYLDNGVPAGGDITTDVAWAAKGDLIAGTGNDTAAILTAGTDTHILTADSAEATGMKWAAAFGGSGIDSGTDQGAAGTAGRIYFRTDLNLFIVDDGTRWVTAEEYIIPVYNRVGAATASTTVAWAPLPADAAVLITRWDVFGRLGGSGTWTVSVVSEDFEGDETALASKAFVSGTNGTNWYTYTESIGTVIDSDDGNSANVTNHLQVVLTEDSGTSDFVGGCNIYFRRIIPDPA